MNTTESLVSTSFLRRLKVFGFDRVEPLILAALVSEDPILLIGKAGTGKTFLLNSISEAMQLEHRHYNASLISFDDLIGYPYPSSDGKNIQFLPTPATIWDAESVLVDEISRCKPEIQNKFFSVIHERKMQGIPLGKLKYRWAAMNPFVFNSNDDEEQYEGSQPLDPALADRFAFVIEVPDWSDLNIMDQEAVINPAGEGALSDDAGSLLEFIQLVKPLFNQSILHPTQEVIQYSRLVAGLLTEAGLRISPRRARLIARNIMALISVTNANDKWTNAFTKEALFELAISNSLPHRAFREKISEQAIHAAHTQAFETACKKDLKDRWVLEFLLADGLKKKIDMLLDSQVDKDIKSLAVIQLLAKETIMRKAIFAVSTFPYFNEKDIVNEEALHTLAQVSSAVLDLNGNIEWREFQNSPHTVHPLWPACQKVINSISDDEIARKDRAKNLFLYLLMEGITPHHPEELENELQDCINTVRNYAIKG